MINILNCHHHHCQYHYQNYRQYHNHRYRQYHYQSPAGRGDHQRTLVEALLCCRRAIGGENIIMVIIFTIFNIIPIIFTINTAATSLITAATDY